MMKNRLFLCLALLFLPHSSSAQDFASTQWPFQIGHSENVNEVSWSPDNTKLLSHSSPDDSLRLWDLKTGRQIWAVNTNFIQIELESHTLRAFDWSADQKFIASISSNGRVQLWEAETGRLLWMAEAHKGHGQVVRFSPDGAYLISIGQPEEAESEIKLWNVRTGKLVRGFKGKAVVIISASFNPTGERLTTGSSEGEISIWNVADGSRVSAKRLDPCGDLKKNSRATAYSPDLSILVGRCREQTVITNANTGKVIRVLEMKTDYDTEAGFSPDGKILVLTDLGGYRVLNLHSSQISKIEGMVNSGFTYSLNNDGSLMAEGGGYGAEGIQITGVKTGRQMLRLESHPGIVNALAFNPDGSRFASGSTDRVARVWETKTKRLRLELSGHTAGIVSVEFSSNGERLASQSERERIVWDATNGRKLFEEKIESSHSDELKGKVTSPGGKYLLNDLGDEKPFQLADARTGKLIRGFAGLTQIQGFKFTPDEKRFLSAAYFQPLQLWDIESGRKLLDFDIGYSHSNVITFSPDGKTFITGGWNQNILLYELESGKLLWSLFPIDQEQMQAHRAAEARRIKHLEDKAEFEKRADKETQSFNEKVYITFDHYGEMAGPRERRMLESDEPSKSKAQKSAAEANAVWLRLHNDSPLPISVPTQSIYLPNPNCFYEFPSGKKVPGLCDNREISVWHGLEDKHGKPLPYGFDFGSSVVLLPNTSALFAVPRGVLKDGRAIRFEFTFQSETDDNKIANYGSAKTLRYRDADLPKP